MAVAVAVAIGYCGCCIFILHYALCTLSLHPGPWKWKPGCGVGRAHKVRDIRGIPLHETTREIRDQAYYARSAVSLVVSSRPLGAGEYEIWDI